MTFDAIVVGSGISGGWVAKELAERGLKTLLLERGPHVEHGADHMDRPNASGLPGAVPEAEVAEHYPIQSQCYAFSATNKHFWVKDSEHPYTHPPDRPFRWIRGYHLGGRSLTWARQSYRMSEMDFEANRKDGLGVDWPLRYADLTPWYDHVEAFAGISGSTEGLDELPDGKFLPPMELTAPEADFKQKIEGAFPRRKVIIGRVANLTRTAPEQFKLGRRACQSRSLCDRGCSHGAYFSSLSATLPAAARTGNLTIVTDAIVHSVTYDAGALKASGVRVIDARSREGRTYEGRLIFVCASTIPTAQILLNSTSEAFPNGIANRSDAVGRYLMDHLAAIGASAVYPGLEHSGDGRGRPNGFCIPRYRNLSEPADFHRGYLFQGTTVSGGAGSPWSIHLWGFGEMLPRHDNRVTLDKHRIDKWGMPLVHIDCSLSPNDRALVDQANADVLEMLERAGCTEIRPKRDADAIGSAIHEMGTVRMGRDPGTSVLNKYCQAHDVPNLFVTDGSCMTSSGCQNPSLTYMALSARAAHHAAEFLRDGKL
jgi:choline dehydrogenase-like flavoprotein